MADEVHIEHEAAAPVTAVVDAGSELTQPVVDHAERITRVEEQQARAQEDRFREMRELEERLLSASNSQVEGLREQIAALTARIEAVPQEVPEEENVELELPDVDASPAPPEKVRQGLRHRRKAKKKGKS